MKKIIVFLLSFLIVTSLSFAKSKSSSSNISKDVAKIRNTDLRKLKGVWRVNLKNAKKFPFTLIEISDVLYVKKNDGYYVKIAMYSQKSMNKKPRVMFSGMGFGSNGSIKVPLDESDPDIYVMIYATIKKNVITSQIGTGKNDFGTGFFHRNRRVKLVSDL